MSEFKREFIELWDNEVKAQVRKCSPEYLRICEAENSSIERHNEIVKELKTKNYIDLTGQYYIGRLVWAVEHALADNRTDLNFLNCFMQVRGCLNDENYWNNVFNNDFSSDEAKELKKLAEMMNKLYEFL